MVESTLDVNAANELDDSTKTWHRTNSFFGRRSERAMPPPAARRGHRKPSYTPTNSRTFLHKNHGTALLLPWRGWLEPHVEMQNVEFGQLGHVASKCNVSCQFKHESALESVHFVVWTEDHLAPTRLLSKAPTKRFKRLLTRN